jgi:hypothetical protein
MSPFSPILGPNSPDYAYADGSYGEPVQRIVNAAALLRKEVVKAIKFGTETRRKRLLAFAYQWGFEAEEIWGMTPTDADTYSEEMRQAVITAVAVPD